MMQRFTVYRRAIGARETHNAQQKNADHEPQFEGVIFSDCTVAVRWLTPLKSTSTWACIEDLLGVHGHPEYGTEIDWHDGLPPQRWTNMLSEMREITQ